MSLLWSHLPLVAHRAYCLFTWPKSRSMLMAPLIAGPRPGSGPWVYLSPRSLTGTLLINSIVCNANICFEIGNKRMPGRWQRQLSLERDKTSQGCELCCHLPRYVMLITCWSCYFLLRLWDIGNSNADNRRKSLRRFNQNTNATTGNLASRPEIKQNG